MVADPDTSGGQPADSETALCSQRYEEGREREGNISESQMLLIPESVRLGQGGHGEALWDKGGEERYVQQTEGDREKKQSEKKRLEMIQKQHRAEQNKCVLDDLSVGE